MKSSQGAGQSLPAYKPPTLGSGSGTLDRDLFDDHVVDGPVAAVGLGLGDRVHDLGALDDLAEDGVALVEVRSRPDRDEELRAVGALAEPLARVGHGQQVGPVELV